MTTSYSFEDRLLEQLRHVVVARPAPTLVAHRRPRRTRLALAGVGVAAAAALVAIVAASGDVPSAYAVQSRPDGAVSVSIHSLSDADGLQRSLRAAGIPAVVSYLPANQRGCTGPGPVTSRPSDGASGGTLQGPTLRTGGAQGSGDSGPSLSESGTSATRQAGDAKGPRLAATKSAISADGNGVTFTIDPGTIKAGENVYITTSTGAISSIGMAIAKVNAGMPCATATRTP